MDAVLAEDFKAIQRVAKIIKRHRFLISSLKERCDHGIVRPDTSEHQAEDTSHAAEPDAFFEVMQQVGREGTPMQSGRLSVIASVIAASLTKAFGKRCIPVSVCPEIEGEPKRRVMVTNTGVALFYPPLRLMCAAMDFAAHATTLRVYSVHGVNLQGRLQTEFVDDAGVALLTGCEHLCGDRWLVQDVLTVWPGGEVEWDCLGHSSQAVGAWKVPLETFFTVARGTALPFLAYQDVVVNLSSSFSEKMPAVVVQVPVLTEWTPSRRGVPVGYMHPHYVVNGHLRATSSAQGLNAE